MCKRRGDFKQGDIVAFYYNNKILLKRVIAVSGELLEYYQGSIEKALSAVNFCLTEDALVLYYNPYDILPYAAGSPEVKVPYADTTIKLALAES